MEAPMSRYYLVVGETLFVGILCVVAFIMFRQHPEIPNAVHADIKLADTKAQVYLQRNAAGQYQYFIWRPGGTTEKITADQLADRLYNVGTNGGIATYLGTSSKSVLIWLGIGLLGQLLFTGRMIVQWIASERKGSSVVPPMFWWMSLIGSLLLLGYFLWRRDPIGLLGQAFGSFVYLKNILWILEGNKLTAPATAEAAEPMPQH
jgi:lipid-A-disaccharide synthase-like uncharacterized protein